jgi:hypothetical protein
MYALNDYGASPPPIARIPTAMRDTNLLNGEQVLTKRNKEYQISVDMK